MYHAFFMFCYNEFFWELSNCSTYWTYFSNIVTDFGHDLTDVSHIWVQRVEQIALIYIGSYINLAKLDWF